MQASDPADTKRILKSGGAVPEYSADIHTYRINYEQQVPKRPGYVLFGLNRTVVHDYEAIDWEFESTATEGHRHVRSIYWRSGGIESYVYAHSAISRRPETLEVLKAMRDHATP
jgi:hypothetical protein